MSLCYSPSVNGNTVLGKQQEMLQSEAFTGRLLKSSGTVFGVDDEKLVRLVLTFRQDDSVQLWK